MTDIVQVNPDGGFTVLQPLVPAAKDFLNGGPIESNVAWTDFLNAFDFVVQQNIEAPIRQLSNIRQISRDTDEAVLRQTCKLIGFDLSSDFYKLSEGDILRIVNQLPLYVEQASNINWNKFLDLVLNSRTDVKYLWTKDYQSFHPLPLGMTIENGGPWYKTTHVEFQIELLARQELIDAVFGGKSESIGKQIQNVFYEYAPITLVVERIILTHTMEVKIGWSASITNYIHEYVEV